MLDKDKLANTLLRAGVTPRDLTGILNCTPVTLYQFLNKGKARRLTEFSFEKIERFLEAAIENGVLPFANGINSSEKRRAYIKSAFGHWNFSKESFTGFTISSN